MGVMGLACAIWAMWQIGPGALRLTRPPTWRVAMVVILFCIYALGPLVLMRSAEGADANYADTLRDVAARPGRVVEFDRADIKRSADRSARLVIWTGETLQLTGLPIPAQAREASIRGRFVDANTVDVTAFHLHPAGRRDTIIILGLGLVAVWWTVMLRAGLRRARA